MYLCEEDSTTGQTLRAQLCKTKVSAYTGFPVEIPKEAICIA